MKFFRTKKSVDIRGRVWQLDSLRGAAMILMAVFHLLVDLRDFFAYADIPYFSPPWSYIGRTSAILFMLISGVSCRFSKNNLRRGLKVLLCGLLVTAATFFVVPEVYIRFGILHFLGCAMVLTGLLDRALRTETQKRVFLWIAVPVSLAAGQFFARARTELPFLFPLGLITDTFVSYDYYPLFPWLGLFLAGFLVGGAVSRNRERLAAFHENRAARALGTLGRYSLPFYLLHQPALLLLLYLGGLLFPIIFHL
ncbi:MAG: DUF1624 domain-containing protein [Clostridiales bacterium]|jgi:uncharacterized membrane protein|nr:DUF1624 domain-containing protein [Clostridiales bacterium]